MLIARRTVIFQADTELGTVDFLGAVHQRQQRAVVGLRNNRRLKDRRQLKDLSGKTKRGLQLSLEEIDYPFTVSWCWFKRADGKRELCFVASTYPYSGIYLVRLGRKR
ncbi:MAG: hypothetical protein F6K19_19415 [Cyanothece sp. SIO1E1]|nr:hypothetical protein [Cyanothece sp. SIO1E1]